MNHLRFVKQDLLINFHSAFHIINVHDGWRIGDLYFDNYWKEYVHVMDSDIKVSRDCDLQLADVKVKLNGGRLFE
jgi:hypothetical protein